MAFASESRHLLSYSVFALVMLVVVFGAGTSREFDHERIHGCVTLSVSLGQCDGTRFSGSGRRPSVDEDAVLTAADFVQAALQAEAAGDAARREALLREALDNDPEYAPRLAFRLRPAERRVGVAG